MKLKVLNLNIFAGNLLDAVLQFIQKENPDIFCLQEVFNGTDQLLSQGYRSLEVLIAAFPEFKHYYSPELLCITPEGKVDIGNAIFSRYPIVESTTTFFQIPYAERPQFSPNWDWSTDPHNLQQCVINVNGSQINVFNLHGVWGHDGNDNPARLYMSQVIADLIKGKDKTIFVGDTNVQPKTKTVENIEKLLQNVFKDELETSFNLKHKDLVKFPGYATAVVDMFFVSSDITVLSKKVPTDDVSDHLPLVCELEV